MGRSVQRRDRERASFAPLACVILLLCLGQAAPAQELPGNFPVHPGVLGGKEHAPERSHAARELRYTGPHPFDILHYKLDLSFAMTSEDMGGTVGMRMVLKSPADSLTLHQAVLALDTIWVDGVQKSFTVDSVREAFTIDFGALRDGGDTLDIVIRYRRIPGFARPGGRRGYYYFTPDAVSGSLPDTLAYTMSEPSDARFWIPCYDDPSEKGTAEINATVPLGFVAASNGELLGAAENGDGTVTWRWKEDHQITPYLMCVTISKWSVSTYPFVRAVNDTVPVQYFVFSPDSARAASYLPVVAEMIGAFSQHYGSYPFDKYGMSAVTPFGFGGMEHQSMTTLLRGLETSETVVAHELAHQWWGDLVTCGTWADIWLNESFATYSEAIWREHLGGFEELKNYMRRLQHFNVGSWNGAVYDPEGQGYLLFSDLVYSKGAWVLHTLRGVLGDSVFFEVLHAYRGKFAGGSAITEDLRAVADSVSGTSMAWFFDQWIYKPGWPLYAFHSSWAADTATLLIHQQQSSPRPIYTMPIEVRFYHDGADTTLVVQNSTAKQTYKIPLAFRPDSVKFDPDGWILKQVVTPPTGVEETRLPLTFGLEQNYPNPFNPRTWIRYSVPTQSGRDGQVPGLSDVKITVYDMLGREVGVLVNERKPAGTYEVAFDGTGLASGMYVYRLTAGLPDRQAGPLVQSRAMMLLK